MHTIEHSTTPTDTRFDHADADPAMPYPDWTREAVACLRAHWPGTGTSQLEALAAELFSDPVSGVLPPRAAVERWMRNLEPRAGDDAPALPP